MEMRADAQVRISRDALKDLGAHFGGLLDDVVFVLIKAADLVDDLLGNAYLSYVMEKRDIVDLLALFGRFARELCDLFRVLGDSCGMTVSVFVLCIDRVNERCCGLGEEAFRVLVFFFLVIEFDLECDHRAEDSADDEKRDY